MSQLLANFGVDAALIFNDCVIELHFYGCMSLCVQGMLRSRGRRLLFADADGATKFADIEKLEAELVKLELTSQACDCRQPLQSRTLTLYHSVC